MNLKKLFETQKKLDEHIIKEKGLQGQDLLDKKILALQVELGELANELPEVFKFWSNKKNNYEKALKEYVDSLHFILSIGNDLEVGNPDFWFVKGNVNVFKYYSIIQQFVYINGSLCEVYQGSYEYDELFYEILGLGEMLGFTWEQIEQAYYEKNEINHARQHSGY